MKKSITFVLTLMLLITPCITMAQVTAQIRLNGVNVGESGLRIIDNGTMVCSISAADTAGASVILATYTSDETLYNVKIFNVNENDEFTYCFDAEHEYSAKLMFWNSCDNAVPLRQHIDFNGSSGINAYYYDADNRLLQIDKANGNCMTFTYDNMGNLLSKTVREEGWENND